MPWGDLNQPVSDPDYDDRYTWDGLMSCSLPNLKDLLRSVGFSRAEVLNGQRLGLIRELQEKIPTTMLELKASARDWGYSPAEVRELQKAGLAALVLALYEQDPGDEEDEDESLTEDQLRDMSLAEVKTVARELGIEVRAGTQRNEIVELILDMAAEEDHEGNWASP